MRHEHLIFHSSHNLWRCVFAIACSNRSSAVAIIRSNTLKPSVLSLELSNTFKQCVLCDMQPYCGDRLTSFQNFFYSDYMEQKLIRFRDFNFEKFTYHLNLPCTFTFVQYYLPFFKGTRYLQLYFLFAMNQKV